MRIIILGGDGYLGWPTAMHFSRLGDDVAIVDNFTRRVQHLERGTDSLTPITPMQDRVAAWEQVSGHRIESHGGDYVEGTGGYRFRAVVDSTGHVRVRFVRLGIW